MKQAARSLCVLLAMLVCSPGLAHAATVAAGQSHSVLVTPDGQVWVWGSNSNGQLGTNEPNWMVHLSPFLVSGLTDVIAVAAGDYHTLALKSDGTVVAWGSNEFGEVGDNTTNRRYAPITVGGLSNIIAIAAGGGMSMALAADGTVYTWGDNISGNLGIGNFNEVHIPTVSTGFSGAIGIAAGKRDSYVIKSDGSVWGAGWNGYGQLGVSGSGQATPVQMGTVANVIAIAGGFDFSVLVQADQTAWGEGNDLYGQLGISLPYPLFTTTPTVVSAMPAASSVAAGYQHAYGLAADGTVWSWGLNNWGQLGDGSRNDRAVPTAISGLTNIVKIAAGLYHGIAVDADGAVYTWGYNMDGELGNGSTLYSTTPVQISGSNYTWKVPPPLFSVGTGTYSTDQVVTIASSVDGAEIHYTLDGSDPTQSDPTIANGGTVTIDRTKTLKARAWNGAGGKTLVDPAVYDFVNMDHRSRHLPIVFA